MLGVLLPLSAVVLGEALQVGAYAVPTDWRPAMLLVSAAFLCCLPTAFSARAASESWNRHRFLIQAAVVIGIVFEISRLFDLIPIEWFGVLFGDLLFVPFKIALLATVILLVAAFIDPAWRKAAFVLALVAFIVAGSTLIAASPRPYIDVDVFHRLALRALAHWHNPYEVDFPDIYHGVWQASPLYDSRVAAHGLVIAGYPYTPLTLLALLPAELFAGDYRYSLLVAVAFSAWCIFAIDYSRSTILAAALFLLTPRVFNVIVVGWTEPLVALTLTATVLCLVRHSRWLPVMLGLFWATKQYAPLTVVWLPLLFATPQRWRSTFTLALRAGIVASLVTVPFLIWNAHRFLSGVLLFQIWQPFRPDALSFLAVWQRVTGHTLSTGAGLIGLLVVMLIAWRRSPSGVLGWMAATTVSLFAFFIFSKQAFTNYYFLVIAAECTLCAVSSLGVAAAEELIVPVVG